MFSVVSGGLSGGSGVGEEKRLDAMNAVCVYVSTAQLVLQFDTTAENNGLGEQRLHDLTRLFGQLRQLLSCAVCARLLNDPYEPLNNARCQHNVCRLCVRGRKALRPLCINCKDLQDFKTYAENKTMRCLLLCYKSLCEHLLSTNFYNQLSRQKAHQALTCSGENVFGVSAMPHMTTCGDIIQEGARYDDILNAFSADLPQFGSGIKIQNTLLTIPAAVTSVSNQSAPIVSAVTPLAPLLVPQKRIQTQTAPRLSTSPIAPATSTNNALTLLPTHTAIIKREQTNNHGSSTTSNAHILMTSKVNVTNQQQQQTHGQSHMLYVKNIKTNASESNNIQTPHLCATQSIVGSSNSSIASLSAPPTITYVGPNTPGIVVPIVSSSATTTAPLTIASAKLQSLKRQLAQAQARGGAPISIASAVKAAGLNNSDNNASVTFKVSASVTPSSAIISSATTGAVASPTSATSTPATTTTATITSQQIRNPPSIKTVSNGSAMYSVLYTGVGNKITIKRKTDADEENGQRKTVATAISTVSTPTSTPAPICNTIATTQQQTQANKLNAKRRGCRCGNATPTPGKLTCCGQRCPCYVDSKSCIGCKCRGCRNPHRPDGGKVRPVIPELACYEIQVADETPRLSPNELQVGNTMTVRAHNTSTATTTSPLQHPAHQQQAITIVSEQQSTSTATLSSPSMATVSSQLHLPNSSSPSSKGATLIPFISLHPISTQQHQQQQQQTQTVTTISGNQHQTNMLPMESVLIQNAEGKYQVVNVLTTGQAHHHQQNNASIQRIHSIPQLQVTSSANGSSNHSGTLLGNMTTVNILTNTSTSNTTTAPTTVTTKSAQQSVLLHQQQHLQQQHRVQQQQQQQKHHLQQIHGQRLVSSHIITTSANNTSAATVESKYVAATSLPLQLQHHHQQQQQQQLHNRHTHNQQVKQNIVTMRPATISNNNNMHHTQTLTPILSSSATTITLSPIIVSSSPNTFKTEMFSTDSTEAEYLNFTTGAVTSTSVAHSGSNNNSNMLSTIYSHSGLSNAATATRITSVPSLSSGSTGSGSGSASRMSLGMNMNITGAGSHMTPALVEVIEASDM
ncbi:mucin-4 [Zeugodacus cucurbitae]|nr:mucin-4 [Zeugodacus cucurbitae]